MESKAKWLCLFSPPSHSKALPYELCAKKIGACTGDSTSEGSDFRRQLVGREAQMRVQPQVSSGLQTRCFIGLWWDSSHGRGRSLHCFVLTYRECTDCLSPICTNTLFAFLLLRRWLLVQIMPKLCLISLKTCWWFCFRFSLSEFPTPFLYLVNSDWYPSLAFPWILTCMFIHVFPPLCFYRAVYRPLR